MRLTVTLDSLRDSRVDAVVRVVSGRHLARIGADDVLADAGPDAVEATRQLGRIAFPGGLPVGSAVTTTAGVLTARWIIHVRPPAFDLRRSNEHELRQAYRSVLAAADEVGAASLAIRPLGTVDPYWPLDVAVRAAVGVLPHVITGVRDVRLVVRTPAAVEPFAEALARR